MGNDIIQNDVDMSYNIRISNMEYMKSLRELGELWSKANNIPDAYKRKPEDCTIAIDMAMRMGVSPLMVMQSLYVVKGKPSWSGQACFSFIEASPKFKNAHHVYVGTPGQLDYGCYVSAVRTCDGEVVNGVCVTMWMAQAEGWTRNSKWCNMPELMLAYRASAFFARVHCPSVLMGMSVEGEVEDITAKPETRKADDVFNEQ
ncbi:MAG: hypothetical protein IJZ64_06820 [Ruminococcus sp.]|nr:hypothetical protein [Ruminococcus sp.]